MAVALKARQPVTHPHLTRAFIVSVVVHACALTLMASSPHWVPVPETTAQMHDAIEVQLFAGVSWSEIPLDTQPTARSSVPAEEVATTSPQAADQKPNEGTPLTPATPVRAMRATKEAALSSVNPPAVEAQAAKRESITARAVVPTSVEAPKEPPPPQKSAAMASGRVPDNPVRAEVQTASKTPQEQSRDAGTTPHRGPAPDEAGVKQLMQIVRSVITMPEPTPTQKSRPEARSPVTPPSIPDSAVDLTEPATRDVQIQETVREVLQQVAVPGPMPSPTRVSKSPEGAEPPPAPAVASVPKTMPVKRVQVQEAVGRALRDVKVPEPMTPSASPSDRGKPEKPPAMPVTIPELPTAPVRTAEMAELVGKVLQSVAVPDPLAPSPPIESGADRSEEATVRSVQSELKIIQQQSAGVPDAQVKADPIAPEGTPADHPHPAVSDAEWERAYFTYASQIKAIIDRNWHWHGKRDLDLRVVVRFRIHQDGKATHIAVAAQSGNVFFDRAALRAVAAPKRLPSFPPEIEKQYLDVEMDFVKVKES